MRRCLFLAVAVGLSATPVRAQVRHIDPDPKTGTSAAVTGRAAVPSPTESINEYGPPEYGFGLTEKDALDGWISLFDGKTTFGWSDAKVQDGLLISGQSTTKFRDYEMKADIAQPGRFTIGGAIAEIKQPGPFTSQVSSNLASTFKVHQGLTLRSLAIRPSKLQPLFNGKDLAGWKRIDHPKLPKERWPSWTIKDGAIHAVGGPGCLEYQERKFGDLIWQVEARMNVRQANGGLFFRAIPGDFMNGYEAQLYNRCQDGDPGKPAVWATGAIDDRQNARRLMSRDGHWLVQTVIAHGPHIATWVNGHQTVDWTDTREKHENPRRGLRVEPGVLQLQAHDVGTDIEFRKVRAQAMD
jgi:hypothetical protein